MIYAVLREDLADTHRSAIARAILDHDAATIQLHVARGDIVHILDIHAAKLFFCIYCRIPVFPTDARAPAGLTAQSPWHFEHARTGHSPGECIGQIRRPPIPKAIGILNPAVQGCYVALGCETNANGHPTDRHRTNCQTIRAGRTYCHLAGGTQPPCV